MDDSWKRALVIGLGKSGQAAASALLKRNFQVACFDSAVNSQLKGEKEKLELNGAQVFLGEENFPELSPFDFIVLSPGVPKKAPVFEKVRQSGVPFFSEVELAYQLGLKEKVTIVGVTGTNGKTTVTQLIGEVLREEGKDVLVGGNIGNPLSEVLERVREGTTLVCELSSFQLETIVDFRCQVAVILNITEDHLDWHPDFADYLRAKAKILKNQTEADSAVFNYDDLAVRNLVREAKGKVVFYSKFSSEARVWSENDWILTTLNSQNFPKKVFPQKELKLRGQHNLENVLAVVAVAEVLGIASDTLGRVLSRFEGLPHRLQLVGGFKNLSFYDDSKATNPDAVLRALDAFSQPVVLLLGGLNKGNSFKELAKKVASNSRSVKVVLFGQSREEIGRSFSEEGIRFESGEKLKDAFEKAVALAKPGDVILLSPGCASFDEFSSYAERGDYFQKLVRRWAGETELN